MGVHLVTFRTEKLRPSAPMVLGSNRSWESRPAPRQSIGKCATVTTWEKEFVLLLRLLCCLSALHQFLSRISAAGRYPPHQLPKRVLTGDACLSGAEPQRLQLALLCF